MKRSLDEFRCAEPELREPRGRELCAPHGPKRPRLADLAPFLGDNLTVLFVGFNPGEESLRQQHHYAHPSNLFWRLFNALDMLAAVLAARSVPRSDPRAQRLFAGADCIALAANDAELVHLGIGFTDLVLRCTRQALQLSRQEKLANVPRLAGEFAATGARHIVIVGKGIWETIAQHYGVRVDKRFVWGLQSGGVAQRVGGGACVHVVPSTSGLVALMKYADKLALWRGVARAVTTRGQTPHPPRRRSGSRTRHSPSPPTGRSASQRAGPQAA